MATFPVKWLHSQMRGAPVKSGSGAGSIVALLKASLIDGFGQVTLTSLVVSGGVATATVNAGDSFEQHAVVFLDGATPATLNGEQRVATSASTTFTFATGAPDGAATGVITCKYAPVGHWEQTYTGTNKAVFKSTHPESNGFFLRVDETADAQLARVVGYESMTDVDTGIGPFPNTTQNSGGGRWWRSQYNTATASEWLIVADGRKFYFCNALFAGALTTQGYGIWGFGDLNNLVAADGWASVLAVAGENAQYGYGSVSGSNVPSSTSQGWYVPRPIGGAGAAIGVGVRQYMRGELGYSWDSGDTGLTSAGFGDASKTADGQLVFSPVHIYEGAGDSKYSPRADFPGLYHLPYFQASGVYSNRQVFDGAGALAGRKLLAVRAGSGNLAGAVNGITVFDITGPWR